MDDKTQTDPQNVEGTWGNLASGKYPVAELFRRTGERLKATWKNTMNDPIGTVVPRRAAGGRGSERDTSLHF